MVALREGSPGPARMQLHHVVDLYRTILQGAGIDEPAEANGSSSSRSHGVTMCSVRRRRIRSPGPPSTSKFRHPRDRPRGWVAACFHGRLPWRVAGATSGRASAELERVDDDFSEALDVVARFPEKLRAPGHLRRGGRASFTSIAAATRRPFGRFRVTGPRWPTGSSFALHGDHVRLPERATVSSTTRHSTSAEGRDPGGRCDGVYPPGWQHGRCGSTSRMGDRVLLQPQRPARRFAGCGRRSGDVEYIVIRLRRWRARQGERLALGGRRRS